MAKICISEIQICPIFRNVLHQKSHNALKVFLECFALVESTIPPPEMIQETKIGATGLEMAKNSHF